MDMETQELTTMELSIGSKLVLVALGFAFILLSFVTFKKLIRLELEEMQRQKDR
jgi:hypothetical protein